MNILDEIISFKKNELKGLKAVSTVEELRNSYFFKLEMPSFYNSLNKQAPSIIGEFKRKSPSKGIINTHSEIEKVAIGYEEAGLAAMSILTDTNFFGGEIQDLVKVAVVTKMPLLRKDFIIDEYQIIESKSIGASAILLIASVLTKKEIHDFSSLASDIGLDVLFEIHNEKDLEKLDSEIKIIGVNNRNLRTFEVSMENSIRLLPFLPGNCFKVAESGFKSIKDVNVLFSAGYNGFLIGENFMKSVVPGKAAGQFIKDLKKTFE